MANAGKGQQSSPSREYKLEGEIAKLRAKLASRELWISKTIHRFSTRESWNVKEDGPEPYDPVWDPLVTEAYAMGIGPQPKKDCALCKEDRYLEDLFTWAKLVAYDLACLNEGRVLTGEAVPERHRLWIEQARELDLFDEEESNDESK